MSMLFTLRQVSAPQLEQLINDPTDIYFFLNGEAQQQPPPPSFFARLFGKKQNQKPARLWEKPSDESLLDLDKNWHIRHFAFCLSAEVGPLPQATLMAGGVELGTIDVGYGPARALTIKDLTSFLQFLNGLTLQTFASEVTSESIEKHEIYFSAEDWGAEAKEALWGYVVELRQFIQAAVEKNNGIVVHLY